MALIECKECKHQVSSKAEKCPNCGYKISSGIGLGGWIILIFIAVCIYPLVISQPNNPSTTSEENTLSTSPEIAPEIQNQVNTWQYSESTDAMADGTVKTASIKSNNQIELNSPYSGGTYASIVVRKHPRWGTEVMFVINKGQLICSYIDCKLNVRFDDGKAKAYAASEPDDHSNETLFIRDQSGFIKKLKNSKTVTIEATFYRNGSYGFEFNSERLNWD